VALSIRNAETERLARTVAREAGETLTEAISRALEERLQRLRGRRTADDTTWEILRISRRCSALADLDRRGDEEILGYGDHGANP
jgi:antitoxin VapB